MCVCACDTMLACTRTKIKLKLIQVIIFPPEGRLWNLYEFRLDLEKYTNDFFLRVIFPREERLWNFGGTHKIHKRFLTESTGSTWVRKEERDNVETVHTHLF